MYMALYTPPPKKKWSLLVGVSNKRTKPCELLSDGRRRVLRNEIKFLA